MWIHKDLLTMMRILRPEASIGHFDGDLVFTFVGDCRRIFPGRTVLVCMG